MSYAYDAVGNVTNDGIHSYSYDAESRLVSVDGGTTASYLYDARNWRVRKTSGGANTQYVWEGGAAIAEYNGGSGALISEYIYAGGRMLAREQGGGIRYFHQDRLSTRLITDGNGAVVGTMDHHPYGEDAQTGVGESEKHRLTSYERDGEANTDYAMNRQYHTGTGRFMRPDPIAGSIEDPQSWNRYAYVMNDPVDLIDPEGLKIPVIHIPLPGILNHISELFYQLFIGIRESVAVTSGDSYIGVGSWRLVGYQRSDRDRKADYDWARNVLKNGMPFPPAPTDNIKGVWDCFNKWKFSSTIAGLAGEEFRGFAEALEIGSNFSLAGDILATLRKAERAGVGGPKQPYASGINRLFRAIGKTLNLSSSARTGLTLVGDSLTPALAVVGSLAAGYNTSMLCPAWQSPSQRIACKGKLQIFYLSRAFLMPVTRT